jgi:acetyl esterase/lipase
MFKKVMRTLPSVATALREGPKLSSWRMRDTATYAFLKHWMEQADGDILDVQRKIQNAPKPPWPFGYRYSKIVIPVKVTNYIQEEIPGLGGADVKYPRSINAFWVRRGSFLSTSAIDPSPTEPVCLFFHGGGHVIGGSLTSHVWAVTKISKAINGVTLAIDYSLSPQKPFPFALHDAISAYAYLLDKGISPKSIFFAGDSAGGNLAFALMMWLSQEKKFPMMGGIIGMSPWLDLSHSCPSFTLNAAYDFLPESVTDPVLLPNGKRHFYCRNEELHNPLISPLFASDLSKDLPPVLIQVGEMERLRDEGRSFGLRVMESGLSCKVEQYGHQFHVFQMLPGKMSSRSFERIGEFVKSVQQEQRDGTRIASEYCTISAGDAHVTVKTMEDLRASLKLAFDEEERLEAETQMSPEQIQSAMEKGQILRRVEYPNSLPRSENVANIRRHLSL